VDESNSTIRNDSTEKEIKVHIEEKEVEGSLEDLSSSAVEEVVVVVNNSNSDGVDPHEGLSLHLFPCRSTLRCVTYATHPCNQ